MVMLPVEENSNLTSLKVNREDFTCYTVNTVYRVKKILRTFGSKSSQKKGYDDCFERRNLVSCAALL